MAELLASIDAFDKAAVAWIQANLQWPALNAVMETVTNKYYWFAPLLLIMIFLIWKGGRYRAGALLLLPLLLLSDTATAKLLKPLFGRPRPLGHGGYSMPSVHATNAFAIATLLSFFVRRLPFTIVAYLLAALVAYSRVHIGVHYPTDVTAGAALGCLDAAILIGAYLMLRPHLERKVPLLFPPYDEPEAKHDRAKHDEM